MSAADLEPRPADDAPTVAAFDFDGTLMRGGSEFSFLIRLRGLLPVALAVLRCAPLLLRAAVMGGASADRAKQAMFDRLLSGLPAAHVDRTAAAFAEHHVRRHLRPETAARLEWHRTQGHRIVVISGSPECYVGPAAAILGADAALATRLAVAGGLLTGRFDGRNCRGAEKYARLAGWLRTEGLRRNGSVQPVLWAYGNSRGDLRLLEAADRAVDAGHLGRFGHLRRFERLADVDTSVPDRPSTTRR